MMGMQGQRKAAEKQQQLLSRANRHRHRSHFPAAVYMCCWKGILSTSTLPKRFASLLHSSTTATLSSPFSPLPSPSNYDGGGGGDEVIGMRT